MIKKPLIQLLFTSPWLKSGLGNLQSKKVDAMNLLSRFIVAAFALAATVQGAPQALGQPGQPSGDPCARIWGKKWVAPSEVRACFSSVRVNETVKANVRLLFSCFQEIISADLVSRFWM